MLLYHAQSDFAMRLQDFPEENDVFRYKNARNVLFMASRALISGYFTSTITPLTGMMYSPSMAAPVIMSVYFSSNTTCWALPE